MCIDVFALIDGEIDEKKRRKTEKALHSVQSLLEKEYTDMVRQKTRSKRQKLINLIPFRIRRLFVDLILKKHVRAPKENGYVSLLENPGHIYAYADILHTVKHEFEDAVFSISEGYDRVLKVEYQDYMTPPPEDQRGGHEQDLGKIINDLKKDYREYQAELLGHAVRR